ncbi:MAG: tetratricopeptide repeat protein [Gimesia chilikensis]|uniref:tetratricopeptide repeat protein n=1 Tax=Gimesia chilikensis TaxID=2605989 RepID=UPI00379C1163
MRRSILIPVCLGTLFLMSQFAAAAPLAEEYLTSGKLEEGAQALQKQLKANPENDEARFGLGVVQFFLSFEHLGSSLNEYGLRTETAFRGLPAPVREMLAQNPNPKTVSYTDIRQMLQTWVEDLKAAEKTLSAVKDPKVKLPLHVGLIKVDLLGNGTPVDARFLLSRTGRPGQQEAAENFVIDFDRGDADWLAGYCNFLCAWGEVLLAIDGQKMFNCTAHLFFEKVETPYPFLMEGPRNFDSLRRFNRPLISDILAFIHLWRFELKEPERMKAALAHLEDMQRHAKSMWKFYLAETDNEREWIPNPQQTGVLEIKVTQEMVDTWLVVLDEAEEVLQGKKLIPFWRGKPGTQGVNLRRVFTEPREIDPFLWFQGTAAAPYLEKGEITDFANPELWTRINRTFGRNRFFTLAFWFN